MFRLYRLLHWGACALAIAVTESAKVGLLDHLNDCVKSQGQGVFVAINITISTLPL